MKPPVLTVRRRARPWLRLFAGAFLVALFVLFTLEASARVGGGESFGGGDSGGGDSGGGGDASDLVGLALWLVIEMPELGVPVVILAIAALIVSSALKKRHRLPSTVESHRMAQSSGRLRSMRAALLEQLRLLQAEDPHFSEIVFLDFASMIYTRYELARGGRTAEGLSPYLSEQLQAAIAPQAALRVERVVIGSLSLRGITALADRFRLECEVEANCTEVGDSGEQAWYSRSRLTFERRKGVRSKGPDRVRSLGCPACGGPSKQDAAGVCEHCGQAVKPGMFDWELGYVDVLARTPRLQVPLGAGSAEVGLDFPSVRDPELDVRLKELLLRGEGQIGHLQGRARDVFLALQRAWSEATLPGRSENPWEQARAYESDRLFQAHQFWIDTYRERGFVNLLDRIEIQALELVKLGRDAFFESATLRIRASMCDATLDREGKVIAGSKDRPRVFSEYWTFIRSADFEPPKSEDTANCPSCAAPLKVAMDAKCEYCGANLSSGRFGWTLATIEQDEAYAG